MKTVGFKKSSLSAGRLTALLACFISLSFSGRAVAAAGPAVGTFAAGNSALTVSSLTPDISNAGGGTTVIWTAAVAGGSGTGYQYQFSRLGPDIGRSTAVWSASNVWAWTTSAEMIGNSTVTVMVKDSLNATASKFSLYTLTSSGYTASGMITLTSNMTVTGKRISNASGPCIKGVGVSNVQIYNNIIGPCGPTANDSGVDLNSVHDITVYNNSFDDIPSAMCADNSTSNIVFHHNVATRVRGPAPRGQMVQIGHSVGSGNQITCNVSDQTNPGYGNGTEDHVNLYQSSGTAASPILIKNNKLRGGCPSTSGGGIMVGDGPGSYITADSNILVNPGQYGITIAGGDNNKLLNNKVYSAATVCSNVGLGLPNQYTPSSCANGEVRGNHVNWRFKNDTFYNDSYIPSTDVCTLIPGNVAAADNAFGDRTITAAIWNETFPACDGSDVTAPTVSITAPAGGAVVSGSAVSVTASASDAVGVAGVQFKLDGVNLGSEDTVSPYSVSWNTTSAGNGSHALAAVARDAAGNTATSASVTVTVNNAVVDTSSPTVTAFTVPTSSGSLTIGITAFTAADGVGVTGYLVNEAASRPLPGAAGWTASAPAHYTFATSGSKTLYAWAKDAAGNVSASLSTVIVIDNTAPTVAITAPTGGATVSGTLNITASAADAVGVVGVQFKLDGVNLGAEDASSPYSYSWDTNAAANGSHALTAVARDAVGNAAASVSVTVTVGNADAIPPSVSITEPAGASDVSGVVDINVSAADDNGVASVKFYVDSVLQNTDTAAPYTCSLNTLRFTNAAHTIMARAYDAAANMAASAISLNIQNDQRTDAVTTAAGGLIVGASANITVPPLALPGTVEISVVNEAMDDAALLAQREAKAVVQALKPLAAGFRLLPADYTVATPVKLKLPVRRSIAASGTVESVLSIYEWDAVAGAWVALSSMYNAADDTMNAETGRFTLYRLFSTVPYASSVNVGEIYVFPDPAKKSARPVFHIETDNADKVEIQIFDFSGSSVHKKTLTGAPALVNRNSRLAYAYEYEWNSENAASGVYFYLIKISKGGADTVRKGKFAVIR